MKACRTGAAAQETGVCGGALPQSPREQSAPRPRPSEFAANSRSSSKCWRQLDARLALFLFNTGAVCAQTMDGTPLAPYRGCRCQQQRQITSLFSCARKNPPCARESAWEGICNLHPSRMRLQHSATADPNSRESRVQTRAARVLRQTPDQTPTHSRTAPGAERQRPERRAHLASGSLDAVGSLGEGLVAHKVALVVIQLELRQHRLRRRQARREPL